MNLRKKGNDNKIFIEEIVFAPSGAAADRDLKVL